MQTLPFLSFEIDIKRFTKGKRISKGGFATVCEVTDKESGEKYAAKILDCNVDESKYKKMINREISIMLSVNNPTIIKTIGYTLKDFEDENNFIIIMKLAQNGSVGSILKKIQNSEFSPNYTNTTRQIILIGVARGMKYLHDRNIIHRDLKCDNVLLDENYHPLISDFGLSKIFEAGHSKSHSHNYGTLFYMAPEIFEDESYGRKVDVYAFGIMMYEIVTDLYPYPEFKSDEMNNNKFYKFCKLIIENDMRPEFKSPVKQHIRELIEQCWSKNPNDRPTFKEIFKKVSSNEDFFLDGVDHQAVGRYIEEITKVDDPIEELLKINETLEKEKNELKEENARLMIQKEQRIEALENENQELREENARLKAEIEQRAEASKISNESQNISSNGNDPLNANQKADEINVLKTDLIDELLENAKPITNNSCFINQYKVKNCFTHKGYLTLEILDRILSDNEDEEEDEELSKASEYLNKQFFKKYESVNNIDHPNIFKTFGFCLGDKTHKPAILFEYVNDNLYESIHKFENFELVGFIYEICLAMKYLHEHKINHSNIKISNILINSEKHVKINNFDIVVFGSEFIDSKYNLKMVGHYPYLAPESLYVDGADIEKTDIYAFGVVMHFILTRGQMPKYRKRHGYNELQSSEYLNNLSISIIHECWNFNYDYRPSFEEILQKITQNNFMLIDGIEKKIPQLKEHLGLH